MTRLLLDTHAWVWALSAPHRLGDQVAAKLADATTEVLVSAAVTWEIAIKHRAGRWPEAEPLLRDHAAHLSRAGAVELRIRSAHAIRAGLLPWGHRDPFDRMLAAQALTEDLVLVTCDEAFRALAGLRVEW